MLCFVSADNIALYGDKFWYFIWELPVYVVMGIIAGLGGGIFCNIYVHAAAFRSKHIPASKPWRRLGEVRHLWQLQMAQHALPAAQSPLHSWFEGWLAGRPWLAVAPSW